MSQQLTIVATSYNSTKHLKKFFTNIVSCCGFDNFKLIVVLNEPTDQDNAISWKFAEKYPNNIELVKVKRESIGASLNRGFSMATTEFVAYIDVDDQRNELSFMKQLETLRGNKYADFTYGDYMVVQEQGMRRGRYIKVKDFERTLFTRGSYVGPGHMFRKELLTKCGYWDEQLRSGGDFDFQVRAAFNSKFVKTDYLCTYYTQQKGSGSASSGRLQGVEALVICLRYGIYDKLHMYLDELPSTSRYRIHEVLFQGEWGNIEQYIKEYDLLLDFCEKEYWPQGYRSCKMNWCGLVKRRLREIVS